MKKITLVLAIVATLLVALPASPAQAHGSCVGTAKLFVVVNNPSYLDIYASTVCSDVHVSTRVSFYLHLGSKTGPIVASDSTSCSSCSAISIERFYFGACSNGQKYIFQMFGSQRADYHNAVSKWSARVTCPVSA